MAYEFEAPDQLKLTEPSEFKGPLEEFVKHFDSCALELFHKKASLCETFENMFNDIFNGRYVGKSSVLHEESYFMRVDVKKHKETSNHIFYALSDIKDQWCTHIPIMDDGPGDQGKIAPAHDISIDPIVLAQPRPRQLLTGPVQAASRLAEAEEKFLKDHQVDPMNENGCYRYVGGPDFNISIDGREKYTFKAELSAVYFLVGDA